MEKKGESRLLVRENPEKSKFKEIWGDKNHPIDNIFNLPKPFRCLICGIPGAGKTNTCLRLLLHLQPNIENIFIIHPEYVAYDIDPKKELKNEDILIKEDDISTGEIEEYKGVEFAGILRYIPSESFFKNHKTERNLLIIDDIELKYFSREPSRLRKLDKLFSYTSTHHNLSIIITTQDVSGQVPSIITKFINVFVIHKLMNQYQQLAICTIAGIPFAAFKALISLCKDIHDCIMIDYTFNAPVKYKLNGLIPIPDEIELIEKQRSDRVKRKNDQIRELVKLEMEEYMDKHNIRNKDATCDD